MAIWISLVLQKLNPQSLISFCGKILANSQCECLFLSKQHYSNNITSYTYVIH